jgi:hypothetical protein
MNALARLKQLHEGWKHAAPVGSPWHRIEPGRTLFHWALGLIAVHPEFKRTFGVINFR